MTSDTVKPQKPEAPRVTLDGLGSPVTGHESRLSAKGDLVEIYADGACKGNPGVGGWGAMLVDGSGKREIFGGEAQTTNNRMELTAVIRALEALPGTTRARVHTDSQYVQQGISTWIHSWKRKGWRTADGKPVKNQDLWRKLEETARQHVVEWVWVKGHAGHPGNERADELANLGVASVSEKG